MKCSWLSPEDMASSMRPSVWILAVFGITTRRSIPSVICTILMGSFITVESVNEAMKTVFSNHPDLLYISVYLSGWIVNCLTATSFLIWQFRGTEVFKRMSSKITEMDQMLLEDPMDCYQKTTIIQMIVMPLSIAFVAGLCYLFVSTSTRADTTFPFKTILFTSITTINVLSTIHFTLLALCLRHRFRAINQIIESFADKDESLIFTIPRMENLFTRRTRRAQIIILLRKMHFALAEMVSSLNSVYGFPLMLHITAQFVRFVTFSCQLIRPNVTVEYTEIRAAYYVFLAFDFLQLLLLTSACEMTSSEAHGTDFFVLKVLLSGNEDQLEVQQLNIFLREVYNRRVVFRVFKCFTLDSSFMCGFIGAVISYIVLLLQNTA
ncbi:uncharacterized protein LOC134543017 [Bacillus rossius redtenbacheri]|uniref:uncharacterized protein LOC134543017 n=1 Tax=Bacillus rossius redtenbacheri TaxID=93214 RepID=UPI002FDCBC49